MMYELFPHLGEIILQRIFCESPELVLDPLGLAENQLVAIHRQVGLVFPNAELMFDGLSTIDLAIELDNETLLPIEVKLGHTGLSRAMINQKLQDCSISGHPHGARVSGNILAILNRYFDGDIMTLLDGDNLHAQIGNRQLLLAERWGIVARDHIITSWTNFPPRFNGQQTPVSLELICRQYGRDAFNLLVEGILAEFDFYDTWIEINNA